jgi:uncharacterized caspase-like protein
MTMPKGWSISASMMMLLRRLLVLVVLPVFCLMARAEEPRALKGVALVIGQSKYAHLAQLPNPANDAREIAKLLTDLGFEVDQVSDGDAKKLSKSLRRFTEDADGADAAVLYYSGHGIEAGGENWLVPVDADLDALGDASKSLVPISEVLKELKATVPVAVILLDACRSNPFPPDALLKTVEAPDGAPLAATGLSIPRGFTPVGADSNESLGMVIGFAAEPGLPALDGEAGGNSPYAAALIRHLSAMNGAEFGMVMRMVTEEVYLKTKARQRPWVNESLRRQLYFGLTLDEPKGDDALITGERRKLLLTIAALGAPERAQVEKIAASDAIPMDALYGVLRAMGETNIPKDSETLQKVLFTQSAKIKEMLAERKSLDAGDPDILRLVAASDRAIDEGAIGTARAFLDEAKAKVRSTKTDIEDIEKLVKEKRIANAAILEKSADAAALAFDHLSEAKDYGEAYDWVKGTDAFLAWRYKNREADAWQDHGSQEGDPASLKRALDDYAVALTLVSRDERPLDWAKTQNNLGNTLQIIGKREPGVEKLEAAIAAYRLALKATSRKADAKMWAQMQNNLGVALAELGDKANRLPYLNQAVFAYDLALDVRTRAAEPELWAETQVNLGSVHISKANLDKRSDGLEKAAGFLNAALEVLTREKTPRSWASAQNNLALALRRIGDDKKDIASLRKSAAIYEEILAVYPRETFPVDWGQSKTNRGITLLSLAEQEKGTEGFTLALRQFDEALEVFTYERSPVDWARSKSMSALAWTTIGMRSEGVAAFERSLAISAEIDGKFPKGVVGDEWAGTQLQIGSVRMFMGFRRQGHGDFEAAIVAITNARDYYRTTNNAAFVAVADQSLAMLKGLVPK